MSKFVGSRNPIQCRSHHQKLEAKFVDFRRIIACFKKEIGNKSYKQEYRALLSNKSSLLEDFCSNSKEESSENQNDERSIQADLSSSIQVNQEIQYNKLMALF